MLNRQLGNIPSNGAYHDYAMGWALDGRLPFAYESFHDGLVCAIRWDGADLVFVFDSDSLGYQDEGETILEFVDAQVVHEDGWFDAPQILWMNHELLGADGGYEVRITGIHLAPDEECQPPADRAIELTLRVRDIRVVIDGEVVNPTPGQIPAHLLVAALNENAPAERRADARRRILAQPNFDDRQLMHPFPWKNCWAGCADVLRELNDERLTPFLPDLLEWIIDLDWPGAQTVFDRLSRMAPDHLHPALDKAMKRAEAEGDAEWRQNLARLV